MESTRTHTPHNELRATLRLAIPVIAGMIGQRLIEFSDIVLVGQMTESKTAVAAAGFVSMVLLIPALIGWGICVPVQVLASIAKGEGDLRRATPVTAAALVTITAMVLLQAIAIQAFPGILHHFGQAPEVVESAIPFARWIAWSWIPAMAASVLRSHIEAAGRPWTSFWFSMSAIPLNILLNYALIFGKLGMPELGLEGSGIATFTTRTILFVATWAWGARHPGLALPRLSDIPRCAKALRTLLPLGIPAGIQILAEAASFIVVMLLTGTIGAAELAANTLTLNICNNTFIFTMGVSMAAAMRIGEHRGRGSPQGVHGVVRAALRTGTILGISFMVLMLALSPWLPGILIRDPEAARIASAYLLWAALFQAVDAIQVIINGCLRGLSDFKWPMILTLTGNLAISLPAGIALCFLTDLRGSGLWIGLAIGLGLSALTLGLRLRHRLSGPIPP